MADTVKENQQHLAHKRKPTGAQGRHGVSSERLVLTRRCSFSAADETRLMDRLLTAGVVFNVPVSAKRYSSESYAPCPGVASSPCPAWKGVMRLGGGHGLSGRFIITSLPTIYHCKDGVFRKYQGARTKDDFLSFVDEQKWKAVEPVSSWLGPSSFLMNSMSALFKLSMFIRRCHNYMTEQLGIPVWGSYVIFGLATLFSGLALGLLLVFIADFVCPSRRFSSPDYYQKKQSMQQARLLQQQEEDHEADGEEDDDEEDEDGDQDDVWSRRRGSPEGRPEPKGQGFSDEALRKRVVGNREEEEEEDT
ncbi:thioredoxin-related transmembrane protein 1 [Morone saxatilis]|uniref:thioredoxin-related transmembrane protein 1 n=1 Tax=Morone saxatilis TaxID=34816 RepID=UPI0015E24D94|nr:thioredoxin-related transmembrane protein 1 [Morone saxatilis]